MSDSDDGRIRGLRWEAADTPIAELVDFAREMHVEGLDTQSVQEVVNASVLVEFAAEDREPAEVARLVTAFSENSATRDLARLVLDAAAARRTVADLDVLVGTLADQGFAGQAGLLLEAVVLRRMPRDIAELLDILLEGGRTMLIDKLTDARTPDECRVSVVFWLRARGRDELARQTARQMAERLRPSAESLSRLVRGLLAQQDTECADAAVESLAGRDPREFAGLILALRENGPYAIRVIDDSFTWLDPGDLLVLASLIEQGGWPEGARRIWSRVVPAMPEHELIDALAECEQRTGNPASAAGPLRVAAETHPVRPGPGRPELCIAELAIRVTGRIRDGQVIVLQTTAERHSVADVFDLAGQLDQRGRGDLSRLLLSQAAARAHGRPDCAELARFIDQLLLRAEAEGRPRSPRISLTRRGYPVPADVRRILDDVAGERKPERLMDLIAGLERLPEHGHGHSRYRDLHEYVEETVARAYGGAELARLPLVRRQDHLLAVLEIVKKALERRRDGIAAEDVPAVLYNLKDAGADEAHDLRDLLAHIGAKNRDRVRIAEAFRARGHRDAADLVLGGPKNVPLYGVRFYPPDRR